MQASLEISNNKVIHLLDTFDNSFFEIGDLLQKIKILNKKDFQLLLNHPKLGKRKGYYLLSVHRVFSKLNVAHDLLIEIGWTKLVIILSRVLKAAKADKQLEVKEWLDRAKKQNARNLKLMLKDIIPVPNARVVQLYLSQTDYNEYAKAIIANGGKPNGKGLLHEAEALMKIIKGQALPGVTGT